MNQIHPSRQLPPLGALRVFEAAARHLNFRRAADELALTPTAVSHQVRALEQRVGLPLFERQARGVRLTPAGQALFPVVRDALDDIARAWAALRPQRGRPVVTVSATRAFTARWLVPRLDRFAADVPGVDLRLHASDEPVDLRQGGVDLAVRYGEGRYPGLQAEPLLPGEFLPVRSPRATFAQTDAPADWPLLAFEWRMRGADTLDWPRWFREAGLPWPAAPQLTRFNDEAHAIQAAIAGHGVVLASRVLVAGELAADVLRALPGPVLRGHDLHLLWRPGRDDDATLAKVRDWLRAQARDFLRQHPSPGKTRKPRPARRLSP